MGILVKNRVDQCSSEDHLKLNLFISFSKNQSPLQKKSNFSSILKLQDCSLERKTYSIIIIIVSFSTQMVIFIFTIILETEQIYGKFFWVFIYWGTSIYYVTRFLQFSGPSPRRIRKPNKFNYNIRNRSFKKPLTPPRFCVTLFMDAP